MEYERAPEDRPYLRPIDPPFFEGAGWWAILAIVLLGIAIAYFLRQQGQLANLPVASPHTETSPTAPAVSAVPTIRYPLEVPTAPRDAELPALQDSDAPFWAALKSLFNENSLVEILYSDKIILRIVATVDNLPRKAVPTRMMPAKPVPGTFAIARTGITPVIAPANSARYRPYVEFARSIEARKLIDLYIRFYPLFQKAYSELGYPKGHFNDRLIEAIDDLLETPTVMTPVRLAQPKVLYEFAADDLQALSAGQKMMIRMGNKNAATVKAKLREIRAAIVARVAKH